MLTYNRTGADAAEKTMTYQGNRLTGVSSSGSGASGSVSYDAIGRVVSSDIEGMTEVQYNVAGFPSYIGQADGGYVHNTYAGGVRLASRRTAADGEVTVMNYEGNEVWENGKLRMLLFDGGYVDFSGNRPKYCWYTKDHLGNVRAVADSLGYIVASYDYRPYGEELAALPADEYKEPAPVDPRFPGHGRHDEEVNEPTPDVSAFVPTLNYSEAAPKGWQPFRFGGKEWDADQGTYDFGARMYSPSDARWSTMDPLCEKYYHISPYAYCAGNPVNLVDPDGRETWVINRDGVYEVIGGVLNDDLNIYEYHPDDDGNYTIRGESIGQTATATSFYDSDTEKWAEGSLIDPNDNSGKDFLASMDGVSVVEYMDKARTNHEWDFKVTNGTPGVKYTNKTDISRGMPVSMTADGQPVYASARDVGNMAAGFVAGRNGLSWGATRFGCDLYQSYVTSKVSHNLRISVEGATTVNAQYYGWQKSGRSTWGKGLPF